MTGDDTGPASAPAAGPGFATGGYIRGPGTDDGSDLIPAVLSTGCVPADVLAHYTPGLVEALQQRRPPDDLLNTALA